MELVIAQFSSTVKTWFTVTNLGLTTMFCLLVDTVDMSNHSQHIMTTLLIIFNGYNDFVRQCTSFRYDFTILYFYPRDCRKVLKFNLRWFTPFFIGKFAVVGSLCLLLLEIVRSKEVVTPVSPIIKNRTMTLFGLILQFVYK